MKTLLIVFVLLCVGLSWFAKEMVRAERQRKAVEAISEAHGWFYYDYEWGGPGTCMPEQEPPTPEWLRKLVGEDLFSDVVAVSVPYRRPIVDDAFLKHLKGLSELEGLYLFGTQITDAGLEHLKGMTSLLALDLSDTLVTEEGIEELQKALPNCRIAWDDGDATQP